ncbi:hypothetical protein QYS49_01980 [Marivirga salinae]|uniref:Uncharacterized protein n=1 Tax=Marivirga salinarum TaxID=3059078 RepID=A0AA49GDU1_9BACT|nr:hypothetical protein [Marivirga sp. BDSF4-3]WKK76184.2 hypothetical protein QYS49_01980 [Marivirga sp. BDSF4-3]
MNNIKSISIIILISAFLMNCDGKKQGNEEGHSEHETQSKNIEIELNQGEKWVVNEEMKPFLKQSEEILQSYNASNDSSHLELADQLKAQNDQLISSCTMKGKSHDELHKWLHPHLQLVKKLQEAESKKEAEAVIQQLEDSYEIYHQYFQ